MICRAIFESVVTRFVLIVIMLIGLSGCGPLFVPMLPRLDAKEQQGVDEMWNNMLTPVQRVNRETLLDANIEYWMYALGVDRLRMTSEKYFAGGKAVMDIECDRANPDADQYKITVFDNRGGTIRLERYTRAEVEESSRVLRGMSNFGPADLRSVKVETQVTVNIGERTTQASTNPASQPAPQVGTRQEETPEQRKFRLEFERRQAAVIAATQPARLMPLGDGSGDSRRPESK